MTQHRFAGALPIGALVVAAAIAVAGCTGSSAPSAIASAIAIQSLPPIQIESAAPTTSEAPSTAATEAPSESELPSAVATDIDPCQLITSADASQLVGVKFGAGKATETENNVKLCTYAAPGPNIFSVEVAVAPDVATAQAAEAAALQDLKDTASQQADLGLNVEVLPSFGPNGDADAAMLQGSKSAGGISLGARALYVLHNTTLFGFSDISLGGSSPPSEQAMKDKATEILATLP